jgi:thiol-disulfide isomerase/thioredoxin
MKLFGFVLLSIALIGCKYQSQENLTISFDLPENINDTVNIFYSSPFDFVRIDNHMVILDSLGRGDIQLDWGIYAFARLDINGKILSVFTCPDGELKITGNIIDLPSSIKFSGSGANVNDYIVGVSKIYKEHNLWNDQPYFYLDSIEFLKRRDTIQSQIEALNAKFFDEIITSDTLIQLLNLENESQSLLQLFNYELFSQKQMDIDLSALLENQYFLNTHSLNQHIAIELFLQKRISGSIWDKYDVKSIDSITYILPQLIYDEIMSLEASPQLKELLSAKVLFSNFSSAVLTPAVDTIYDLWQKTFPNSDYGQLLESKYQSILTLESGIVAPEVHGITPEGDSLKLSELKGNVVYIKVWATWCAPCLKSFPDWKKLQQEFADKNEVVFLTISVDKDIEKWRDIVTSRQLSGININTDSKKIREDYLIPGIPRYMLIDQNGILVDAKAPSPSEDGLKGQILKLIDYGR